MDASSNTASKYVKPELRGLIKRNRYIFTTIVGEFNTPLSNGQMQQAEKQSDIAELNSSINQLGLIDVY